MFETFANSKFIRNSDFEILNFVAKATVALAFYFGFCRTSTYPEIQTFKSESLRGQATPHYAWVEFSIFNLQFSINV